MVWRASAFLAADTSFNAASTRLSNSDEHSSSRTNHRQPQLLPGTLLFTSAPVPPSGGPAFLQLPVLLAPPPTNPANDPHLTARPRQLRHATSCLPAC